MSQASVAQIITSQVDRRGISRPTATANAMRPILPIATPAPGKGRFIYQNQNVEWISVSTFRRGQKSEVVRKSHSRWQYLLQFEHSIIRIEGIFVAAALGRFNHHLKELFVILIAGGKDGKGPLANVGTSWA